jgi:hypothetical protein
MSAMHCDTRLRRQLPKPNQSSAGPLPLIAELPLYPPKSRPAPRAQHQWGPAATGAAGSGPMRQRLEPVLRSSSVSIKGGLGRLLP